MQAPYDLERLEWDAWNRDHIAKHDVSQDEVEEVVSGIFVALQSYKQRTVLLGPTRAGRMLAVVLGPVPGKPGV